MAQVYVGTYTKYNNADLSGEWLDLEDYADYEDFIAACKELHKDEADPELMFQDFEGFPVEFYHESRIDPRVWDWLELDDGERKMYVAYTEVAERDVNEFDCFASLLAASVCKEYQLLVEAAHPSLGVNKAETRPSLGKLKEN